MVGGVGRSTAASRWHSEGVRSCVCLFLWTRRVGNLGTIWRPVRVHLNWIFPVMLLNSRLPPSPRVCYRDAKAVACLAGEPAIPLGYEKPST